MGGETAYVISKMQTNTEGAGFLIILCCTYSLLRPRPPLDSRAEREPAERECERCVGAPITTVLTPNIERVLGDRRGVLYTLLLSVVAPLALRLDTVEFRPKPLRESVIGYGISVRSVFGDPIRFRPLRMPTGS